MAKDLEYQSGLGNEFSSESKPNSLPLDRNNPQKVPLGLYAEQLSGSAFTAYPEHNFRTWLYKAYPSAVHDPFEPAKNCGATWMTGVDESAEITPNRLRWSPYASKGKCDFIDSVFTVATNGSACMREGSAIHLYSASASMTNAFQNHDGEMLVVAQQGSITFQTELGLLEISPGEIAVIPRGMKFRVLLNDKTASGYICENYGQPFALPYRGPIGANSLASRRHFLAPVAATETSKATVLVSKFLGSFWHTELATTPFDVVAWYGNYVPYKYNLDLFNTIGTVSFDHPDPSIFTVLTSGTHRPGIANVDFVIFPPRWMVGEDTFRPPYFHRNIMSEYMGLITGVYDAKPDKDGFVPGGGSLHNCMSAHGPEYVAFDKASKEQLKPHKLEKTLAFMFESSWVYQPTAQAMSAKFRQENYDQCWSGFPRPTQKKEKEKL